MRSLANWPQWRRWESNPASESPNPVVTQEVMYEADCLSGNCQDGTDATWPELTSIDADLESLLKKWCHLSHDQRHAIMIVAIFEK